VISEKKIVLLTKLKESIVARASAVKKGEDKRAERVAADGPDSGITYCASCDEAGTVNEHARNTH
jgi:hypothetical protein